MAHRIDRHTSDSSCCARRVTGFRRIAPLSLVVGLLLSASALGACDRDGRNIDPAGTNQTARGASSDAPKVTTETIRIRDERFVLEVAATREAIARGLGGRESIPDDGGMIFVFPDSQVRHFWMLDCLVDIDIMFIDSVGGVTAVHRMKADPQRDGESRSEYESRLRRYSSISRAQFAIELKAGSLDRLGIDAGDRLSEIDWRRVRRHAR